MVNEALLHDLEHAIGAVHASAMGGMLAYEIGRENNIPAYVVDPVVVDEMAGYAERNGGLTAYLGTNDLREVERMVKHGDEFAALVVNSRRLRPMDEIRITLLANAGVLIQWRETRILVDGIHRNTHAPFSGLSQQVFSDLLRGANGLGGIQHLLYTHGHIDHFTAEENVRYLRQHPAWTLMLPEQVLLEHPDFLEQVTAHCGDIQRLRTGQAVTTCDLTEHVRVQAIHTAHAGREFSSVQHVCYLLRLGDRSLLLLSDSACSRESFSSLGSEPIDGVLANPLFLNQSEGRLILSEILCPAKLIVYHIPFRGEDTIGFRRMVERDVKKYKDRFPPTAILWNKLQTMVC